MFSPQHLVWLAVCIVGIVLATKKLDATKPGLNNVLTGACVICAFSEVVKLLTYVQMVPTADGSTMNLFIEWRHLPLHLCSIQILFIFYVRFAEKSSRRDAVLAFMYPTCILGAAFALLLPSIFPTTILPEQAFTSPIAYQFFLFHSMLVTLGIYIARSGEVTIRFKHLFSTYAILAALTILSIYANSALSYVTYRGTELLSVENTPNFFFTFRTPIGIQLTQMWHWYVYLGILLVLAIVLIAPFYLPYRKRAN